MYFEGMGLAIKFLHHIQRYLFQIIIQAVVYSAINAPFHPNIFGFGRGLKGIYLQAFAG
jgi:hypothetical protein